ncbi:hypothetical protein KFL_005160050 [Klebsormidium nitens]|uniref:Uncharacterized protein n=1 Tax=Klebsormidium nitens TaxID=105231 RepID=A0A1Y1IFI7_KLENI|nr:hypothetical protein KFL_005160050 [Klebsormidium nitens]|eukprot:GAQ89383.1 hypothetical protein KFL_005160050 [Klebsormidium nitens]
MPAFSLCVEPRIGSSLFLPTGVPTSILQVAFNAEASAIEGIKQNFPPSGNAVGTADTGCGPGVTYPSN